MFLIPEVTYIIITFVKYLETLKSVSKLMFTEQANV